MYKICKTLQSAERQKQFQKALVSMMETQDYHTITITALCRKMNAPRQAFYRYYEEMDDVISAYIESMHMKAFLYLHGDKIEVEKFFLYWKENRKILELLNAHGLHHLFVDAAIKVVEDSKDELGEEKTLIRICGQVALISTIVFQWNKHGMELSVEDMSTMLYDAFFKRVS